DVPRSSRTIDRKGGVAALADVLGHFSQSAEAASGAGASGGAIAEALDAVCDGFPIAIHAGHNHDTAIAPVISCRKKPAMPEGENRAISGFVDRIQVSVAYRLPAHGASNDGDDEVADPADQPDFHPIQNPPPTVGRAVSPFL